ncbi:hypothetical protein CNYM01_01490 [Colletotrichum nymphaeae SA-01]|uniref:EDC4-like protein pdc1 beta-propeller domain-containing protein n=1 Tax=Colletotrichum nymphaeae SA-01 TaxID=1460502 RepID=A0A135SKY9_9PEZI|nr:hypothetical protein CNYM01_01490 [Colletotrichum nymphaeae SA-01]
MVSPMPPAPTPPGGSMPSNGDRSNNLLNLLKFSGVGSASAAQARQEGYQQQQQQQQQQSPQQQQAQQHHYQQSPQQQHHHQHQQLQHQPHQSQPQPHQQGRDSSSTMPSSIPTQIVAPARAPADPTGLLAALMKGAHDGEESRSEPPQNGSFSTFGASSPPDDTRAYLLNLLNRPKPSQNDLLLSESTRSNPPQAGENILHRVLAEAGQAPNLSHMASNSFEYDPNSYAQSSGNYGTYSFPSTQDSNHHVAQHQHQQQYGYNTNHNGSSFDESQITSPHNRTPKTGSISGIAPPHSSGQSPAGPAFEILKKAHDSPSSHHSHHSHHGSESKRIVNEHRSPLASPERIRHSFGHGSSPADKLANPTPGSTASYASIPAEKNKETVSEAIHDIAQQADYEAQQALARAEEEQSRPEYLQDLEDMDTARTEREFEESAHHAAQAIKKELEREENRDLLEKVVSAEVAEEVREIIEEAASHAVADSWESADQDEIVVIEEETPAPVKVFNFPMKPWISIALQDSATEPRPQFRDDAIMDIARLKKEFDQIDRNLYTATENYMAYGMSKAGGLRVIRQDDGKDAKIFTDTKDRIFNVAMSVTPTDHTGIHREAIIGTGITGTVYWVQIKSGEKDHIEDAHPEQYGFALPPMASHEGGDAPGGVLKTRARTSTIHPEFFAVGRGKSINIIWPTYIMQNNLFKPGHDRVVDTERLAKQCSLKINTGKAGKDFTFSQDDSVIVSLDKSGRVKFWDVRDLTAAKEGSDPRAPIPAHTSLEVKEPLMTLTSTPEGEKAWPTSVLLVDKLRPYQKRCALRYMIIGMKQNHTLQLWDLALGKPVQEFNLPHTKESDAVCSVMYHPPTGMLVIGHPTRNSIYFAHLSAPKYNLKSVSQVDYIQRLVAQDTTIPAPDSTAVISGVREYSFANRGILRSLDILCNPAMAQETDEPTLFELYAMHSKGVACLLIKQAELGWTKDNKVLAPVDAVDAGVVTISKLKPPASQPAEPNHQNAEGTHPSARNIAKDSLLQTTPSHDDNAPRRGPESVTPVKIAKAEPKEEETPVPAPAPVKEEKPERKSRKKKAAAAAAAAAAAGNEQTNGSPRVGPSNNNNSNSKDSGKSSGNNSNSNSITQESVESAISSMETRLQNGFNNLLNSSFKTLHGRIDEGLRAREADFDDRQLKLLNMVSEVLNENTQKVLEALIQEQFSNAVIPAIADVAGKAVSDQFTKSMNNQVSHSVQKEIHKALPSATQHALQNGDFVKAISDRVGATVAANVQQEVVNTLTSRLAPSFTNMATQACQRVVGELQKQHRTEMETLNAQRLAESNKVDQLSAIVTRLTGTISSMAASQEQFQNEFLKFQQQMIRVQAQAQHQQQQQQQPQQVPHHQQAPSYAPSVVSQVPSQVPSHMQSQAYSNLQSPDRASQHSMSYSGHSQALTVAKSNNEYDADLQARIAVVNQPMKEGRAEEAVVRWMQSGREQEVFEKYMSKYSPEFVRNLPHLVLLTVTATVSLNLESHTRERIAWLEMVVHSLQVSLGEMDGDARAVTPKIMGMLVARVEGLFVRISSTSGNDPVLKNLSQIIVNAKRVIDACQDEQQYA